MTTIREQIIKLIKAELEKITQTNGYMTNIGQSVVRGRYDLAPPELPAIVLLTNQDIITTRLDHGEHEMPVIVNAHDKYPTSSVNYSDVAAQRAEAILGDIQTCLLAPRITLDFSSGVLEPSIGTTLTGSSSGATAILESITLSSGSWPLGTAAGTFSCRLPWLDFTTENVLNSGGETLAATTGTMTRIAPFSDLLNYIEYQRGGIDPLPDIGEDTLKVPVEFSVVYVTLAGNPYKQS